jgi:Ni,Fe-hydrogenase III large subunit
MSTVTEHETAAHRVLAAARQVLPDAAWDQGPVVLAPVETERLESVVGQLAGIDGARLADLFASDGDRVTLRLVWALDPAGVYLILQAPIAGSTYPALSRLSPAVFLEECEVYEQFGLRPADGAPLNRVALPPLGAGSLPRLGHGPDTAPEPTRETHASHLVGGSAFEFPVGPVRAVGVESLYYGLVTSGEEIVDVFLMTWHKHRGIEWRLRGRTPGEALFHVERLEGLSVVGNTWAFAQAAEDALGIHPVPHALRARALALELERLYNHAAAMAALCQATGLAVGQAQAEIALERLLRVNAAVFGHRYLFGVIEMGGVRRGPDLEAVRRELPGAYGELQRCAHALLGTNSFLDRLEATGTVTVETAGSFGLVGPIARASGIDADTRRDHPRAPYNELHVAIAAGQTGDCLARLKVMLAEAGESVRLIGELCDTGAGAAPPAARPDPSGAARFGLGHAESARGESLVYLALDSQGRIARARLRPAAVRNWRAFDHAARAQNVFTDIPIIEASFWLTVAGTAR